MTDVARDEQPKGRGAGSDGPGLASGFGALVYLIKSDLYRYTGRITTVTFLKALLRIPGFRYSFLMRVAAYLRRRRLARHSLYYVSRIIMEHYQYKYGIMISPIPQVGSGLYINHCGGILVHDDAVIGRNCNISHGVTVGQANRGARKGCPTVGDNVYIGSGAVIIGNVKIGNNVAVGANSVVTTDIPDNAVVVGIPGKVISYKGSEGYVNRTDYDTIIGPS